jgi:SAM-dependent methyltransferase
MECLYKLLNDYEFKTILDVGAGAGRHADIFLNSGKHVTAIDYGGSDFLNKNSNINLEVIVGDYVNHAFNNQFDCIWCSHTLEHVLCPNVFLNKLFNDLRDGGILAITVPSEYHRVESGHLNVYSAGHLLYQLVRAGFDCSDASVKMYGYNLSVIIKKKRIEYGDVEVNHDWKIKNLSKCFPKSTKFLDVHNGFDYRFKAKIKELNWD